MGGAVEINLASMALVPLNGLIFCLPIPILGASPFTSHFIMGLAVVASGACAYNHKLLFPPKNLAPQLLFPSAAAGEQAPGQTVAGSGPRVVPGAGMMGGLMPGDDAAGGATPIQQTE